MRPLRVLLAVASLLGARAAAQDASAEAVGHWPRGLLASPPVTGAVLDLDRETGLFRRRGGASVLLRALENGDEVPGAGPVWALEPELQNRWFIHLGSHGVNALIVATPEAAATRSRVAATRELMATRGLWVIAAASVEAALAPMIEAGLSPEARAETLASRRCSGFLLRSGEVSGEALWSFALWTESVPWGELAAEARPIEPPQPGLAGVIREGEDRRRQLAWIRGEGASAGRAIILDRLPAGPLLADIFSLGTHRRRRVTLDGPRATLPLTREELGGGSLVLVTERPADWVGGAP